MSALNRRGSWLARLGPGLFRDATPCPVSLHASRRARVGCDFANERFYRDLHDSPSEVDDGLCLAPPSIPRCERLAAQLETLEALLQPSIDHARTLESRLRMLVSESNGKLRNARQTRIALYSHDTMGLGHVRRNLLLAQALCASRLNAAILLIAGTREAATFRMPPTVDSLTLPALSKGRDGQYSCRHMPISLQQVVTLRSGIIRAALEAFEPDVLIVDNVPRGALRELDATLIALRAHGGTRVILGLRDVLDDPAVVRAEWSRAANVQAIRDYYHAIWVYGDPLVYDPVVEYGFGVEVVERVRFAGYLDQRARLAFTDEADQALFEELRLPPGRLVLGAVGGGQDGARLADAFTQAELPAGTNALLLTGPFMPVAAQRRLRRRAERSARLRVVEFVHEPSVLLHRADCVVAMGGYGTTGEILSFEKHALIVPRVLPRREQFIRAQRLAELGLVHAIHPDEVTPERISTWLARDLGAPPRARSCLDFAGLERVPVFLEQLLDDHNGSSRSAQARRRTCHAWT